MAKISAYGEYKIAEARRYVPAGHYPGTDIPCPGVESVYALTSGGRILERLKIDGDYQSGGYSVRAKIKKGTARDRMIEIFTTYTSRRGAN